MNAHQGKGTLDPAHDWNTHKEALARQRERKREREREREREIFKSALLLVYFFPSTEPGCSSRSNGGHSERPKLLNCFRQTTRNKKAQNPLYECWGRSRNFDHSFQGILLPLTEDNKRILCYFYCFSSSSSSSDRETLSTRQIE